LWNIGNYDKKIAYYQSISDAQQAEKGINYPKKSKAGVISSSTVFPMKKYINCWNTR
jgi:hypothetical protein